ncbi:uncharacterized protein LOC122249904 isoform X2 [Penaeus japonicus]|uniref:uncharacterized protein LOC122249904 isoform X2 n=1 Tax=Penaeus japonicus TaxID=27405 RepID=UPI001C70D14A|nr:uncharacterized protein LOC122249904 isoform X2 [Penaeus japonicus]
MVEPASLRVPCVDERRSGGGGGGGGGGTATSGRLPPLPPQRFLLPLLLLALALLTPPASGIKCYECVHNNQRMKRHNRYVYPCSEFDGSDRYIMNCPDSKLCIYQRITLPLTNDNIIVRTMDGCTPNTTDNARYAEAGLVKEGCIQHKSVYKPPSSEYCYCSHNLCNGTTLNFPSTVVLAILLATVLFNNHQWPRS